MRQTVSGKGDGLRGELLHSQVPLFVDGDLEEDEGDEEERGRHTSTVWSAEAEAKRSGSCGAQATSRTQSWCPAKTCSGSTLVKTAASSVLRGGSVHSLTRLSHPPVANRKVSVSLLASTAAKEAAITPIWWAAKHARVCHWPVCTFASITDTFPSLEAQARTSPASCGAHAIAFTVVVR